ncbi:MAG TPA: hypothetical protein VMY06_11250, partial [Sedimentisphaerales bacterium]|nr:hypothetical protein [Sedimentisphaerales bacterium]
MPNMANLETQYNISRRILQKRRAKLTKLGLQPVANRYLIYCMAQDRINIRIYLVRQIWRRMFQQSLRDSSGYAVLSENGTKG